ncbi:hypothetical protein O181_060830 [Austropuccinia psidii MF-1]|uniref:CCHC-type domain-containing protein n=1 Tax=Austropuccinia psidii MF-1 TaxID=1389203 RepID=A0A9Q3EE16_9BASI|nr:hypothetical protein [Austropuccinia psidii MF-1]
MEEVAKKKNSCHNCGSTDHYFNNCPKAKKKVPEEESPTEYSESESMGDAIREQSDEETEPIEEFLVEYCKAKKKVYAIEKVPEEEPPTEDSDSDSMGDAIREPPDDDQEPREEFLVEYQEETPLEIQDIQFEAGMPQDTSNKNLCKHTQDAQTILVTPTK